MAVHPANSLVVPKMTMIPQVVGHLFAAPAWLAFCQSLQVLHNFMVIGFLGSIAIGATIQVYGPAGSPLTQTMLIHQAGRQLAALFHSQSFFSIISLRASCSRLKFAYISFKRRFSSSNSFRRFNSLTDMPLYLAFHL